LLPKPKNLAWCGSRYSEADDLCGTLLKKKPATLKQKKPATLPATFDFLSLFVRKPQLTVNSGFRSMRTFAEAEQIATQISDLLRFRFATPTQLGLICVATQIC
jgi:hypothetical protein